MMDYNPDNPSAPGETLFELLEEKKLTIAEFAWQIGRTEQFIDGIIKGEIRITQGLAIQLDNLFSTPVEFWINRESNYRKKA